MRRAALRLVAAGVAVVGAAMACMPPPPSSCEPGCATAEPACDDGCPAVASALCLQGACVPVLDGTVDVVVDANVDRRTAGVVALLVAVVDARVADCGAIADVASALGVLAGNRFAVSGGTFHEDLAGGLVPPGDVVVAVDAIDDAQAVLAHGCTAAQAAGDRVDVLVAVEP
ncbi:MAG: hypothetical protein FJ137_02170 [Deltaproteobacteria bacterium]|nr:hypothetical protein [Deltaproteobacteria bacterium]